ncbi:MAG: amino acid permease [Actinomycetota bacterium]|nr:amino acid permease [Actinomycetota bacterium]
MGIMRTKSVEQSIRDTDEPGFQLRKALGPLDLTIFGIGVMVGTGIFVLTGVAAATNAGPAIALSFVVSAIACALAALCYAELASTVPVAGSAYTFSYAAIGEFLAWIIGWDLILEFTVGAATVSIGWSQYFNSILQSWFGISLPAAIAGGEGAAVNLPAAGIALLLTAILVIGITLSSRFNQVITTIKVLVILFFIVFGAFYVSTANWTPFVPSRVSPPAGTEVSLDAKVWEMIFGGYGAYGFTGIIAGAAIVFFAYIGFDIVATTAEETREPQRDMPIGILGSLAIVTVLYVLVSLVMTGIVPYPQLETAAPMATAFEATGQEWATGLVSLGAILGLTSVIMILLLGQSRVGFAMSRDSLLPPWLGRTHPRFRTPYRLTLITGVVVAILAAFTSINTVAELVNIGTLFAFILVSIGVIALRRSRPELPRAFRTPLVPVIPILAVLICFYLMLNLAGWTWVRFFAWMIIGVVVYFLYSMRSSRLRREESGEETSEEVR